MSLNGLVQRVTVATWILCVGAGFTLVACGPEKQPAAWSPHQGPPPSSPSSPTPSGGCSKDTDCKGDRVCEAGTCRAPQ